MFGDRMIGVVRLRLDRPQIALPVLGYEVNAGVRSRPAWPIIPKPHLIQHAPVCRIVPEVPPADLLELATPTFRLLSFVLHCYNNKCTEPVAKPNSYATDKAHRAPVKRKSAKEDGKSNHTHDYANTEAIFIHIV